MSTAEHKPLTLFQMVFLTILMPSILFALIELACRIVDLPKLVTPKSQQLVLEMPTWMQREDGVEQKAARLVGDEESIDWLNLFESGEGYRVRLKPNITRRVSNTFAQIPFERADKYEIRSNALGFRGPNPDLNTPGSRKKRILVFGDSSSFGWGVDEDLIFSNRLQGILQSRFSDHEIEVLNFAIPGDSSEFGRLLFDKFAGHYPPDIVVLGFGANDAKFVRKPHAALVERFTAQKGVVRIVDVLKTSSLIRSLSILIEQAAKKQTPVDDNATLGRAVPEKRFRENLKYMTEKSRELGASKVFILSLCSSGEYSKRAKNFAKKSGAFYLNGQKELMKLIPAIKAGKYYPQELNRMTKNYPSFLAENELFYVTSDSCHPNRIGQMILADKIAELLVDS